MSDANKPPEAPSDERLKEIYAASPGGTVHLEDIPEMDQKVFDELKAQGFTDEYSTKQAKHASHLRHVYARSRSKGSMAP